MKIKLKDDIEIGKLGDLGFFICNDGFVYGGYELVIYIDRTVYMNRDLDNPEKVLKVIYEMGQKDMLEFIQEEIE